MSQVGSRVIAINANKQIFFFVKSLHLNGVQMTLKKNNSLNRSRLFHWCCNVLLVRYVHLFVFLCFISLKLIKSIAFSGRVYAATPFKESSNTNHLTTTAKTFSCQPDESPLFNLVAFSSRTAMMKFLYTSDFIHSRRNFGLE